MLDNLSTHTPATPCNALPTEEARRILRRIEFHYTPKHASWLNMVEIEIGVLQRQCPAAESRTGRHSKPRPQRGENRGTQSKHRSTGGSLPKRPGPALQEPTQNPMLPKRQTNLQNHCDETLDMFLRSPEKRDSSASTGSATSSKPISALDTRRRWSMNHAVLCCTLISWPSFVLEAPFRFVTNRQTANTHFRSCAWTSRCSFRCGQRNGTGNTSTRSACVFCWGLRGL